MKRLNKSVARVAITIALIFSTIACNACGPDENKDALREVAKALHRVANATARADEVTHRFFLDGVLSGAEAEAITTILDDINKSSRDFQRTARTYSTFDAQAQSAILKVAGDSRDFISRRIADGAFRIDNPRARDEWRAIVNTAHDAFVSIVRVVEGANPKGATQ